MRKKLISIIITITIITSMLLLTSLLTSCSSPVVKEGDNVSVLYVGSLESGKIFDTNIMAKAKEVGIYNDKRNYEPLTFEVGKGQMIKGFENAVIGMKLEETKNVTIPAEEAYGSYDKKKVAKTPTQEEINRTAMLEKTLIIPMSKLLTIDPKVSVGYEFTDSGIDYKVMSEQGDNYEVKMLPKIGQKIALPNVAWEGTIISEDDKQITVREDPEIGQVYKTNIGPVLVENISDDKIKVRLEYKIGDSIKTAQGIGRVIDINNDELTVDFNHALAGEDLKFEITVVKING